MNGVPSVCWVVALKAEAKSIIDELELTPLKMRTNFHICTFSPHLNQEHQYTI